jgi:hypothetical protein
MQISFQIITDSEPTTIIAMLKMYDSSIDAAEDDVMV